MGYGVLDKAFAHGKFGYGNFHQIKACHLIDNAQFAGCRSITGIEFFIAGAVEVNTFTGTYYKGNERIDEVTPKYALLSTHAGRRTFICNALALGIPAQVVMKWTGHSDYKAMKPYIDIADDIKANAMNKFNQL